MKVNYELHKLKNGMRVLLIQSNGTYSATIHAMIKSGSALEIPQNLGITHFIEHLSLMAPTKKWPSKEKKIEITELNGAYSNGSTSKEILRYYINVPYTKVAFGMDFMYQTLYENLFDEQSIEQERRVILDEISKNNNDVGMQNYLFVAKNLSKKNTSYSKPTLGTESLVRNFSSYSLKKQNNLIHDPSKTLLVVVGNFSKKEVLDRSKKLFGSIKSIEKPKKYPTENLKRSVIALKKDKKTENIITSFIFPGESSEALSTMDEVVLDTTLKFLSGPMGSRLFKRLRTKEGLLYNVSAYSNIFSKFGSINIVYDISPANFKKAFHVTLEELVKFKAGITQKELHQIKEYITNRNLVYFDNVHTYSNLIRNPVFWNEKILTLKEINKVIKSLKTKDIQAVINKYFNLDDMSCVAYGNVQSSTEDIVKKEVAKTRNG